MEIWKEIPAHEGYEVSNLGQVRSVDRVVKKVVLGKIVLQPRIGRMLVLGNHRKGYLVVKTKDGKFSKVHRLVAMAFVDGDFSLTVNHKNNKKTDNTPENLEWISALANTHHALYEVKCSSIPPAAVFLKNKKNETVGWFRSMADAARHLGVTNNAVSSACIRGGTCRGFSIERQII